MFINFPKMRLPIEGLDRVTIPGMVTVRQIYDKTEITDIAGHLRRRLGAAVRDCDSYAGKNICITAGSRGIPHLDLMIRTLCDVLKEWGAKPFIIPAMGSHGGATAEGQLEVLAGYNITAETMGVPVYSSMETIQYAKLENIPLYCDRYALESDGIVVFNKVKPHTDFKGKYESGLAKMMAIGLAKHKGAAVFHSFGVERFADLIPRVGELFMAGCPVAFGVGVVQNAYDNISHIEVCARDELLQKDAELLEIAKDKIARFKFMDCDVLIVDEIGKNISGNGFDPNIIGRNNSGNFENILNLKRLVIRGLTPESRHNGAGLACADITTRKCLNSVDWTSTWINCMTAGAPAGGRIPLYGDNDREAILFALRTCPDLDYSKAKVARIKNTLCMEEIQVSESLYEDIKNRNDLEFINGPQAMRFDACGNLL